ncbi:MAG TPA: tetraacyldisaccharide 4'-kinase [Cyclobacteriaceae bacterium]|jgi:tetraacyldisaccharide 4'-kinase|nr:tetraacyldisaccharide 4'-kinase [Cyclobacteriaceae bacterium]
MLSILLAPFSWLYGAVMRFRNFCYDRGVRKSFAFDQAVISVGNLSMGGTGKTPMIEYLVRLLAGKYSIAILSRGYGRKSRGFRVAMDSDDASSIGDEPLQFYKKFKGTIDVVVCEDRVEGIRQLLGHKKSLQVILLDDAFQHRRVRPMFSILLTEFSRPFFNDFVLPKGRLREGRSGGSRTDVVVVTKCSALTDETEEHYVNQIHQFANKPVYFSKIGYIKPVALGDGQVKKDVVLVTGVANSKPMIDYVKGKVTVRYHFDYSDHHEYSDPEIALIQSKAISLDASIITTEKDFVKLENKVDKRLWFYLPIETQFVKNGSEFDALVFQKIKNHLKA